MELIFATHNKNKLQEVQQMMPKNIKLLSLEDVQLYDEIPETAATIKENAILKTDYIRQRFDIPVFADDTGLLVHALNGAPGVISARYAGEQKNSEDNMNLLLENLQQHEDRSAHFLTAISLYIIGEQQVFEGRCNGDILMERQGDQGFGYDPIFRPTSFNRSFAQMDMAEKAEISHRGKALKKLIAYLNGINIDQ